MSEHELEYPSPPEVRKFVLFTTVTTVALLLITFIYGTVLTPPGGAFIGFPFSTDDHMVYAAWMRQAADGHFFFDNRFTLDAQPALTVQIYFFALGLLSKVVGISLASNGVRIILSGVLVFLIAKVCRPLTEAVYTHKLILTLAVLGGGFGFLVWHDFGRTLSLPLSLWMSPVTNGALPNDVWQPEAFVFASMLTNGLFVISLCLMLAVFMSVLAAQSKANSWKPVVVGAIAMALLMNIHSYDALLVALVLLGLMVAQLGTSNLTARWVGRAVLIGLGAIPAALWFVHVLLADSVFAARAATPTYAGNFRAEIIGYLPLIVMGLAAIAKRPTAEKRRRKVGLLLYIVLLIGLFALATNESGYFLGTMGWITVFVITLVAIYLLADESPTFNLFMAWALIGLTAVYFPALFQRKLAMGLSLPWGVLAGLGVASVIPTIARGKRNLFTALVILLFGSSSLQWILREFRLIRRDVSETTVQPVYIKADMSKIIAFLNTDSSPRKTVLSIPGIPGILRNGDGTIVPDAFESPIMPDWNPILVGLTGAYTYAGHWSETADYETKRKRLQRDLFSVAASPAVQRNFLAEVKANYIVAPIPSAFPNLQIADLTTFGEIVVHGTAFDLIRLSQ